VTSAASGGRVLTRVDLEIDRATDRVVKSSAFNEVVTRDVPKDPAQTAIVEKYGALADTTGSRVVGSSTANLTHGVNLTNESSLGDVIADAQLAATSAPENGGAVIAFMNSGGIRADITTRSVTYRDLFAVQPFGNVLNVVTMTGDMIKRVLEQQFDNPTPGGRNMLQVSNGFTYRYRVTAPVGQHVEAASITLGGRPIGPADRVRVEVIDFMVSGGSGYTVFGEGTEKVVGLVDIDALVQYFRTHSPVAPGPQNRLVRID
jgi:5'-nucleotidase